jgi:hypothetical protein
MKKIFSIIVLLFINSVLFSQTNSDVLNTIRMFTDFYSDNKIISGGLWKTPKEEDIWKGETTFIIKQVFEIVTSEYQLKGYNRFLENGNWHSILIQYLPLDTDKIMDDLEYITADRIYKELLEAFGNPARLLDYGFLSQSPYRQSFIAQWEKGKYLLDLRIMDLGFIIDRPTINGLFLQVCNIGTYENISSLININIKMVSGIYRTDSRYESGLLNWRRLPESDMRNYPDMQLILDYNENKALNLSFYPRGVITGVTNTQSNITFYSDKKKAIEIILNRNTGEAEIINYDENGNPKLKLKGIAELRDLNYKPKF